MKLNIALIGGRIAQKHIDAIKLNSKDCKLVAICENLIKQKNFNTLQNIKIHSDIDNAVKGKN